MKHPKSTILFTILLCMFGAMAHAHDIEVANADGVTIYYVWTNNNTELAVSYRGYKHYSFVDEYKGNVVIPQKVDYNGATYSVTRIGENAFGGCTDLTSITIPNSVTSIGSSAFGHCSGLTSITIPNSVTSIGYSAFCDCISLISVEFHCKEIASWFSGLKSIQKVVIGEEVTSIGSSAFQNCSGLTSITILNSVTSIGYSAFEGCSGLISVEFHCKEISNWFSGLKSIQKVVIGEEVTSIGYSAFSYCSGLTSITIPNSVTSIGNSAFSGCSGLTSITIPNSVTSIGSSAFSYCSGMTSITIPNSVASIGNNAFEYCVGLTSITIPNSVTSIGSSAFGHCSGLTSITIPNSVASIGNNAFEYCVGLTSITIPNSVTSIGNNAFKGCSGLTSILTNSVASIGYNVFDGCSSLISVEFHCKEIGNWFSGLKSIQKVVMGEEVTSIGSSAFSGCSGLTSITIPNSVTSIGNGAFQNCSSLISVVIGSGVTSIGDWAFSKTKLRKTIWLTNTPPLGSYNESGVNYVSNEQFSIDNKVVYPFLSSYFDVDGIRYVPVSPSERTCDAIDCTYDSLLTNITIPSSTTYQGIAMSVKNTQPYLCYGNQFIENLTCDNDGIIAEYAFSGCENMKTVTMGEKITSIGDYAFSYCSSLQAMVIPNSVKGLGNHSLYSCNKITKMSIPNSVTAIKDYAFDKCSGLKEFIIEDRDDELTLGSNGSSPMFSTCPLENVYIGGNISYNTQKGYGYSPFYRNTSLRTVIITDKETEISDNEFYGCTNLKSFKIGDGVEIFGDWAFSGCSSLESLSFGTKLKTIGKEAFSDCVSVTEITSKTATPPDCGTQALDDINKWNCKLIVPKGSLSKYQAADQWKEFFFISEGNYGGDTPDDPNNKKCAKPTISYDKGELSFASETEDVEFVSSITDTDITSYSTSTIQLGVTYNISVYATKSGYENSETVTATLCWIDVDPKTEGITGITANVRANAVLIQNSGNVLTIAGAPEGVEISVYNLFGQKVGYARAISESVDIITSLKTGEVGIVKIGSKSVKVAIK